MTNAAAPTAELDQLKASNAALTQEIDFLRQQIRKLKELFFGSKSEKLDVKLFKKSK